MRTPLLFIEDNSPRCHTSGIAPLGIVGDIEDPIEGTYSPEDHVGFQAVFHILLPLSAAHSELQRPLRRILLLPLSTMPLSSYQAVSNVCGKLTFSQFDKSTSVWYGR